MKILYNIAAISNSGGMERVLANKSNWLSSNGYEVIIVTTDQKGKPAFFPIFPTLSGIKILCKDLHPEKAKSPSSFTPSGILIVFRDSH